MSRNLVNNLKDETNTDQSVMARHDKGKQIASKNRVKKICDGKYKVRSQSNSKIKYDVMLFDKEWICSCPDFRYRNARCKHIHAVEFVEFASKFKNRLTNSRQTFLHIAKGIIDGTYKSIVIVRGILAFLTT